MSISETFKKAIQDREKIFIPFITAGDPNLKSTESFLMALEKSGAKIIELGVPFSEPVADGPTIQRSTERALATDTTLKDILDLIKKMREERTLTVPIILFSYLNPIFKFGFELFAQKAKESGIDGVLIVDQPPEEADEFCKILEKNNLEIIFLASPTTSAKRLKIINDKSTGFVYYVSRLGVTGAQNNISDSLNSEISKVRSVITKPLAVGFGISTPEQAREVAKVADGIIVGSALVDLIFKNPNLDAAVIAISKFTRDLLAKLKSEL